MVINYGSSASKFVRIITQIDTAYLAGLELQILKGTHFKAILKRQLRAPRPLHVKE